MLRNGKLYMVLIVSMLIITFCLIVISNAQEKEPVNFGLVTWTEGAGLEAGRAWSRGFEAGIKYINDQGGILGGRKLKGYQAAQGQTGETARSAALMLVRKDKVKVLIGPHWDVMAPAGLGVAKEFNIPFAPDQGGMWLYEQGYPGTLGLCIGNASSRTNAQMRFMKDKGYKTVVILYADIPYDLDVDQIIKERWERPDSPVKVLAKIWYPFDKVELTKELSKAVALNPDFIWCQEHSRTTAVSIIRTLHELGYKGDFSVCQYITNAAIASLPKETTEGFYAYMDYFPDTSDPKFAKFINYFKSIYGKDYLPWGQEEVTFAHTVFLAKAMDKAGTEGDYTMEGLLKISKAMHELKWEAPRGEVVKLSKEGVGLWKYGFMTVCKDGKLTLEKKIPLVPSDFLPWLK